MWRRDRNVAACIGNRRKRPPSSPALRRKIREAAIEITVEQFFGTSIGSSRLEFSGADACFDDPAPGVVHSRPAGLARTALRGLFSDEYLDALFWCKGVLERKYWREV